MKRVILSADDFGLDETVNAAVEAAHRDGVLTSASLMVGEAAAADAVSRARRLRELAIGLHVVLVDGRPVSPPEAIPDLVGRDGRFSNDMIAAGFKFFFLPRLRRQLEREIRAQFEAFAATGLTLDHANAHKHFHLHPTIAGMILGIGREFGLRAMRLPIEPRRPLAAAGSVSGPGAAAMRLWGRQLRRTIRRAGLMSNDHVFGLAWTGAFTESRLLALIPHLPDGVSELYFHPAEAAAPALARSMPEYRHQDELAALVSRPVRLALEAAQIERTSYGRLVGAGA